MTKITFYQRVDGTFKGFHAQDHEGYSAEGQDIVCAAVSILTTTCVNAMESVAGVVPQLSGGKDGELGAMLPSGLPADKLHDCQVLLRALGQGLTDLSEGYPRYVRLSIQERRETSC